MSKSVKKYKVLKNYTKKLKADAIPINLSGMISTS